MSLKQIRERAEQIPFRPFSIETVGGRQITVNTADHIYFPRPRPEIVIVFEENGAMTILEAGSVASLSTL